LFGSLEEKLKPFEVVTDEKTAVTDAFHDVPSGPASQILPIAAEEVKVQIKRLKPNKAPGHDSIDRKVSKALPVTAIFNATIVLLYYPDQWKLANVVMITRKSVSLRCAAYC